MSVSLVVSLGVAATLLVLAARAMDREDASVAVALGIASLGALSPLPFWIAFAPLIAVVLHAHRQAVARAEADREAVLVHIGAGLAEVGLAEGALAERALTAGTNKPATRIADVRDPSALGALTSFRQRQRALVEGVARDREETRSEGRSTSVRSRFMAAMGHELRSPLNSIIGFAQVLEDGGDGPLTPSQRENVTLVRVAAEDLLLLLTDILDSSRLEAGRVRLDRKWTASVEILTLTTQRARPLLESVERDVEAEIQPGLPPLFVDRARIAQSLQNLLRQALKGNGRGALRLRARAVEVGGVAMVRFDVIDPSRDLSPSDVKHAFDPDPELRRDSGRSLALGLALGLARDLARLHGGDASCENAGGACWYLLLPIAGGP